MLNLLKKNIIMNYMYTKELGYLTRKKTRPWIFLFQEAYRMCDFATPLKLKVLLTWLLHYYKELNIKKKNMCNVLHCTCRRVGGVAMAVVLKSADNFSYES